MTAEVEDPPIMGYFTLRKFIDGCGRNELERRLGYRAGRLLSGWQVLTPESPLKVDDFVWQGSADNPDGKISDTNALFFGHVVADFLEYINLDIREQNRLFLTIVRPSGPYSICKIRPKKAHTADEIYPPGSAKVSQWKLKVPVKFKVVEEHGPENGR